MVAGALVVFLVTVGLYVDLELSVGSSLSVGFCVVTGASVVVWVNVGLCVDLEVSVGSSLGVVLGFLMVIGSLVMLEVSTYLPKLTTLQRSP